jgi:uncharacterized protein (TIGR02001 family)
MHCLRWIVLSRRRRVLLSRHSIAAIAAAVFGAVSPVGAVDFSGSATVVSDYRFRGLSLSGHHPVATATVEAASGPWFVGLEAVSASQVRSPLRFPRRNAEIDVSGGWTRSLGLVTPTVGAIAYLHPGGGEAANGEVFASLAGAIGPATLTLGANYAPDQSAVRGGNLYLSAAAAAAVPTTLFTVRASVGRERGGFAGAQTKIDWSGGVEARVLRIVTLGIDYVGNDLPRVGAGLRRNRSNGVVVRAGVSF